MFKKIGLIAGSVLAVAGISFYISTATSVSGDDTVTLEQFNNAIKVLEDKIIVLETKLEEVDTKVVTLDTTTTTELSELSTKIDTNLQTNTTAINNVKTSLESKINTTSTTLNNAIARLDNVDKESNAVMWFMTNFWDFFPAGVKVKKLMQEGKFEVPTKPFE